MNSFEIFSSFFLFILRKLVSWPNIHVELSCLFELCFSCSFRRKNGMNHTCCLIYPVPFRISDKSIFGPKIPKPQTNKLWQMNVWNIGSSQLGVYESPTWSVRSVSGISYIMERSDWESPWMANDCQHLQIQ